MSTCLRRGPGNPTPESTTARAAHYYIYPGVWPPDPRLPMPQDGQPCTGPGEPPTYADHVGDQGPGHRAGREESRGHLEQPGDDRDVDSHYLEVRIVLKPAAPCVIQGKRKEGYHRPTVAANKEQCCKRVKFPGLSSGHPVMGVYIGRCWTLTDYITTELNLQSRIPKFSNDLLAHLKPGRWLVQRL